MRTRRLHAHLAYVMRADDRASVAYAAASAHRRLPGPPCDNRTQPESVRQDDCMLAAGAKRLGSIVGCMMRAKRLHARLAYVTRVDNHAKFHPATLASNPKALGKTTARFSRARAWTV